MGERNLLQRTILIMVVVIAGVALVVPPEKRLRAGMDIAGGASLMFEIETSPNDPPDLAEQMKRLLQKRVDPDGRYNLIWRVHGKNRIEIQMPMPPKDAVRRREAFDAAREEMFSSKLTRALIEQTMSLPAAERDAAIAHFCGAGMPTGANAQNSPVYANREKLMRAAAGAWDALQTARSAAGRAEPPTQPSEDAAATEPATQPSAADVQRSLRDATETWEDAVQNVLALNLDPQRFTEILELDENSPIRRNSLAQIKTDHPELLTKIDDVLARYAGWRKTRGYLDGPEDLTRLLRGAGVLEFRILAEATPENITKYDRYRRQLQERGPMPVGGDEYAWFKIDNPLQFFDLNSPAELAQFDYKSQRMVIEKRGDDYFVLAHRTPDEGLLHDSERKWSLRRANINRDEHGRLCVNFELDVVGGQLFEDLTRRNVGHALCILVDNVAYSAPNIQEKIGSFGRITGDFSYEKVSYLVQTMQAGALPGKLKDTPISVRMIGSSLGEANRDLAIRSGLIGAAAVLLIMAGYYFLCGMIANVTMMMNVGLTIAVMALLQARFTLDGIAGIILGVGMAVDANVLIYERMREEKDRGASLRMVLKNGFDKAFTTIFDSNVTTLLTCLIIYYVGSEEVRGFGLTLGWGVALNMFTSVFVTKTLFLILQKYNLIKSVPMLRTIHVPNIDWYGKRKIFFSISALVIASGMTMLYFRGARDTLDVEFLGGVTAEFETRSAQLNDVTIRDELEQVGGRIARIADRLPETSIEDVAGAPGTYRISLQDVPPPLLAAIVHEPLEDRELIVRGGVELRPGDSAVTVRLKDDKTRDDLQAALRDIVRLTRDNGNDIARSTVNSVRESGAATGGGRTWSVTTTVTNKRLVQYALEQAVGDQMKIEPRVGYAFHGVGEQPFPIRSRRLADVLKPAPPPVDFDLTNYLDGVAIDLDQLDPPQSAAELKSRFRNMRLQPGFQELPYRDFAVVGLTPAEGTDEAGNPRFSRAVVVIADPTHRYSDGPDLWYSGFARPEKELVATALEREQTLRKVSQFKPQIANQSKQQAIIALILSWLMIIAYVWIRFGKPIYGVAGVIALVHDVLVALSAVGLAGYVGGVHGVLGFLLIEDFKINMPIIAALLTIIGFSINDTIVIFDRVREVRGRLGIVTPQVVNRAINECMSRTILTTGTVLTVLLAMYTFGGTSIRGFTYCMLVGCISGVYSTVAIAGPLLLLGQEKPAPVRDAVPARA